MIDALISKRRDAGAARSFFARAMTLASMPVEVTTDRAPVYSRVLDDLAPAARHVLEHMGSCVVDAARAVGHEADAKVKEAGDAIARLVRS